MFISYFVVLTIFFSSWVGEITLLFIWWTRCLHHYCVFQILTYYCTLFPWKDTWQWVTWTNSGKCKFLRFKSQNLCLFITLALITLTMSISHANAQLPIGSSERKDWNSSATTIQLFHHLFNGFYQTIASHHLPTTKKERRHLNNSAGKIWHPHKK